MKIEKDLNQIKIEILKEVVRRLWNFMISPVDHDSFKETKILEHLSHTVCDSKKLEELAIKAAKRYSIIEAIKEAANEKIATQAQDATQEVPQSTEKNATQESVSKAEGQQ